jgi:hypothetical protein
MPARIGKRAGLPRIITAMGAVAAVGLIAAILTLGGRIAARPAATGTTVIVWFILLVAIGVLLAWLVFRVHRLNLSWLGLSGATNIPAIPFILSELPGTILNLLRRATQLTQAVDGLSTVWTIGEATETAYTFMGMGLSGASERAADPRTRLFLDKPEQFAMSWTTLGGLEANATR